MAGPGCELHFEIGTDLDKEPNRNRLADTDISGSSRSDSTVVARSRRTACPRATCSAPGCTRQSSSVAASSGCGEVRPANALREGPQDVAIASLLMVSVAAEVALGAPGGELDAMFGQNAALSKSQYPAGRAIVQQPTDGKLLIAGSTAGDADRKSFAARR